jgi:ribosomal-protein-alanine N-acetyltransferase
VTVSRVLDPATAVAVAELHAIRPASIADAAALAALDAGSQINPWSESQFAALGRGAGSGAETVLVLDDNGQAIGYVVFAQVLDEASIHRIAIHPEQRGLGMGKALLQSAMEQMRRAGARRCLLEVRQSNTVALRMYEANGFGHDGVRKNYYPSPDGREDALLMSRTL